MGAEGFFDHVADARASKRRWLAPRRKSQADRAPRGEQARKAVRQFFMQLDGSRPSARL